jgi:hypothetical protein
MKRVVIAMVVVEKEWLWREKELYKKVWGARE